MTNRVANVAEGRERRMKYIERLKVEHPEFISDKFIGGCEGCPEDYGYEPYRNACPSGSECLSVEEACRRCWERSEGERARLN